MTDFNAIIDAAHKATEEHGVSVQRGKKYSQVNTRVELFRRHLPDWGVQTEIVQFSAVNGEPVVMRATITNPDGAVVGCGHAFEIVGAGNVNKTAALENAETSAIGRALASIGLAGGEYASLNEIDGAQRKAEPPKVADDDRIAAAKEAYEDLFVQLGETDDMALDGFGTAHKEAVLSLRGTDYFEKIKSDVEARKAARQENAA